MQRPDAERLDRHYDKNRDVLSGIHQVLEAMASGRQIEKILVMREHKAERLEELYDQARRARIPVQKVPGVALDRIAERHQGVAAYVAPFTYVRLSAVMDKLEADNVEPFIVVLDGVTDVRNAGGIARSAEAAGVQAMVVPMLGTAQLGSEALRASAGALQHLMVCREASIAKGIEFMQKQGIKVIAISEKGNKEMYWADFSGPIALVLGSEEEGISQEAMAQADMVVKIPMAGKVGSLNVANAAAIALFEVVRTRVIAAKEAAKLKQS